MKGDWVVKIPQERLQNLILNKILEKKMASSMA